MTVLNKRGGLVGTLWIKIILVGFFFVTGIILKMSMHSSADKKVQVSSLEADSNIKANEILPMLWSKSCDDSPYKDLGDSSAQVLANSIDFQLNDKTPRMYPFRTAEMTWQTQSVHYKLNAKMVFEEPPQYKLEYFHSNDESFDEMQLSILPSRWTGVISKGAVLAAFEFYDSYAKDTSANLTTVFRYSVLNLTTEYEHEIITANGALRSWSFESGYCDSTTLEEIKVEDDKKVAAVCSCY